MTTKFLESSANVGVGVGVPTIFVISIGVVTASATTPRTSRWLVFYLLLQRLGQRVMTRGELWGILDVANGSL